MGSAAVESSVTVEKDQSSSRPLTQTGQVWEKNGKRREVTNTSVFYVTWKFPGVTNEGNRNTGITGRVKWNTWNRWLIGDKRRGEGPATLVHMSCIPDHEWKEPIGRPCEQREDHGPQAEWDTGDPDEKTDEEYEGRHDLDGVIVIEDDGEE